MKTGQTKLNKGLILNVILAVALISCTKTREAKFAYGEGENLLMISAFDGKEFDLHTGSQISELSSSQSDKIKSNSSSITKLNVVKYKTSAELMDDSAFIGKTNHKYKIRYELTDQYLKIYKIAPKQDLSLDELTSAEPVSGSLYKIPILGYPITGYYKIEKSRNELNEETSKLAEKKLETKSGATHFKLNKQGKIVFKSLQKIDTFPSNMFDGEWYYAETITATNYANQSAYGANISTDQFGNSATKVKLVKTEKYLNFINLSVDDNIKSTIDARQENQVTVMSIPASWKDYRQTINGKDTNLSEEENTEQIWNKRSYVQLNLEMSKSALKNSDDSEILDIQITDNYFSFVTLNKNKNMKFRHSFSKVKNTDYSPKVYFQDDKNTFGFFYSKKNSLASSENYYKEDTDKNYFINRFNPKNKVIEFRLSENSPDWSEKIARNAVSQWNTAFKKSGADIEIRFNSEKAALGDVRYNILNLISQPDAEFAWGGYGPSISDPQTGEIISSTSNVDLNGSLDLYVEIMRRMADSHKGLLDKNYILGSPLPSFELVTTGNVNQYLLDKSSWLTKTIKDNTTSELGFKIPYFDKSSKKGYKFLQQDVKKASLKINRLQFAPDQNISVSASNLIEKIEAQCPDVKKYFNNLNANSVVTNTKAEYQMYLACAMKVSEEQITNILLHEMGHNFGLRHNFYGSVDSTNFFSSKARTSSTMEYTALNESRGGVGPYDVAAIRFGYADSVQTKSGVQKLDTTKSIAKNMTDSNNEAKKFLYCTDEHVDIYGIDPMCARQDAGITPLEVVTNLIVDYNSSMALANQKRQRSRVDDGINIALARQQRFLMPMKIFYDYWRFQVASYVGKDNGYLESYDQKEYSDLMVAFEKESEKKGSKYEGIYKKYKPAADLAFSFISEIAFLPDYYCLTKRDLPQVLQTEKNKSQFKLFNLSSIKLEIFEKTGQNVNSCKSKEVIEYLEKQNAKLVGQGGYYTNDQYKDLSVLNSIDSSDVLENYQVKFSPDLIGNKYDKALAFSMLSARGRTSVYNDKFEFFPNFYDEPHYRDYIQSKLLNRIIHGVDINSLKILPDTLSNKIFSNNYSEEQFLLNFFASDFKDGFMIPNKIVENNKRRDLFQINFSYSSEQINEKQKSGIKVKTTELLGQTYYATEKNEISYKILSSLDQLNQLKNFKESKPEIVEVITSTLEKIYLTDANIEKYTFADFLNIAEIVNKLGAQFSTKNNSEQDINLLKQISADYFEMFSRIKNLAQIQKKDLSDEKVVAEFMQSKIIDLIAEVEKFVTETNTKKTNEAEKISVITLENFKAKNVKSKLNEIIKDNKSKYEIYLIDQKEFDSQSDILINSLVN